MFLPTRSSRSLSFASHFVVAATVRPFFEDLRRMAHDRRKLVTLADFSRPGRVEPRSDEAA